MPMLSYVGSRPTTKVDSAHDQDGDQEGVLAPDQVAEPAEHQRAERPHQEAGGEGQQREDVARWSRRTGVKNCSPMMAASEP